MNREIASYTELGQATPQVLTAAKNDFYPADTGAALQSLIEKYNKYNGLCIEVSFRELVPWVYGGSRATHYLHSYPAKLLPQIAHFFLANELVCPSDGVVLDPFSGSGTVALETVLSGRNAYYCDVNPFARFLTKAKTTPVATREIDSALAELKLRYSNVKEVPTPDVVNLSYWYDSTTSQHLSRLKAAIDLLSCTDTKDFFRACFSTVSKQLSRANPRFSVPVRLKINGQHVDIVADSEVVWQKFCKSVERAKRQICSLSEHAKLGRAYLVAENVLSLDKSWPAVDKNFGEVDLIITSPPYAGAQKYVRATSLSLGWLSQAKSSELKSIENRTLGREHLSKASTINLESTSIDRADQVIQAIALENPTRAAIASVFLGEMKTAAEKIMGSLKSGGYAVVVMADNTICGRKFETTAFTSELFCNAGGTKVLELSDKIISRSLQTKRASTSSSISHETITVFQKG
ncbi:MAG: hypothetical protein ACI9U6_001595 [Loktanella salsilacus]|jgi:hypothetical protein|uniref:hypothetical protein n=1 Tax=Loktanella salsilacus TaxID=195913 RepID=UPI0039896B7A